MAVSLPKGGDIIFINKPDIRYQNPTNAGPVHPTNYDNFLENNIISRVGFEKFEYIVESEFAHFYISDVRRWSGFVTRLSKLPI